MFPTPKKIAHTISKLFHRYASGAHFQINSAPKPCLKSSKTLLQTSGLLGILYNPWNRKPNGSYAAVLLKRVHYLSGKGFRNEQGMERLKDLSDFEIEEEPKTGFGERKKDEGLIRSVERILGILNNYGSLLSEARLVLAECGVVATSDLVEEVLSQVRNDWQSAYACFLWAGSQPGYKHSLSAYHSMISILGKLKKFDIAWELIRKMVGVRDDAPMVTFETFLIMMKRYSAAHDVAGAIRTFHVLERFKLKADLNAFHALLSVLCRYRYVEDAEQLLYDKKSVFGYDIKSFNIILNGWCNMVVSIAEARRFWKVMINSGINPDVRSYSCMICCFSKAGHVHDVMRVFDQMKRDNYAPDFKVYNAVVYALAKGKCFKEAYHLLNVMVEKGFTPDTVTYNYLIKAFCKAGRLEDAYMALDEMIHKGFEPSIITFHAMFNGLNDPNKALQLYEKMIKSNCTPTLETFVVLIRKFCSWREYENVFKLWTNMGRHGLTPDYSAYIVLVQGLFLNGRTDEAYKYYEEMKAKGFSSEPMIDRMIGIWIAGKELAASQLLQLKEKKEQKSLEREKIGDIIHSGRPWQRVGRQFNSEENFDWTELQKMDSLMRKKKYGF